MSEIYNVTLELLRPGPAHNQLLSPLTNYIALCGADSPVTVKIPFEHRHLLQRLRNLRYVTGGQEIPASQREEEVREIGEMLGRVLADVPSLLAELGNARCPDGGLVHLRLSMSAYELAMVPFEFAIGADGFPASGSALFLQARAPISITREVRRGQPLPVTWNRRPRILFAFACPGDLPPIPAQDHLNALRRAIEPWIRIRLDDSGSPDPEQRLKEVKSVLTVLPDATLEKLRSECARAEYTHVHILAHGAPFERAGEHHFGIALSSDADVNTRDVVDGERLALALTAKDASGAARNRPTLVSLATCDSGNIATVVTTGGSIAHALHAGDIPWVVGSQFPLWMRASTMATESLYSGLLRGDDPRFVLYTMRQRLRTGLPGTHDWASICAYATIPEDLAMQVEEFRDRQTKDAIEVKFDNAQQINKAQRLAAQSVPGQSANRHGSDKTNAQLEAVLNSIREDLARWYASLPPGASNGKRAELLGIRAAGEKRIGGHFYLVDRELSPRVRQAYARARDLYRQALLIDPTNHWVATQHLCMHAVLGVSEGDPQLKNLSIWWSAARQMARWELHNASGVSKAWALGTLAELELLGVVFDVGNYNEGTATTEVIEACKGICDQVGYDAFAAQSTLRQFARYRDEWSNKAWNNVAQAAIWVLTAP